MGVFSSFVMMKHRIKFPVITSWGIFLLREGGQIWDLEVKAELAL